MADAMTAARRIAESMPSANDGAVKATDVSASMPASAKRGPNLSTQRPM